MADVTTELKVIITAINNATGVLVGLQKDFAGVSDNTKKTAEGMKDLAGHASKLAPLEAAVGRISGAFKLLGTVTKVAVSALAAFESLSIANEFVQAAAHSEALEKGLRAIGISADYSARQIDDTADQLKKLGLSSDEAAKSMTRLMTAGLNPTQIVNLTQTARVLATAFGKTVSEVEDLLSFAVTTGMTRGIRRAFGLQINAQTAYRAEAEKRRAAGLSPDILPSEQPGVMASYISSVVNQKFGQAGGDNIDTTNQKLEKFKHTMEDVRQHIGDLMLPTYRKLLDVLTDIAGALDEQIKKWVGHKKSTDDAAESTSTLANALEEIDGIVRILIDHWDEYLVIGAAIGVMFLAGGGAAAGFAGALGALGTVVGVLLGPLIALAKGVAAFAVANPVAAMVIVFSVALYEAYKKIEPFRQAVDTLWETLKVFFEPTQATNVFDWLVEKLGKAKDAIQGIKREDVPKPTEDKKPLPGSKVRESQILLEMSGGGGKPELTEADKDALRKSDLAKRVAYSEQQLEIEKGRTERMKAIRSQDDADTQRSYNLGLTLMEDYYEKRVANTKANTEDELKVLKAEGAKLAAERELALRNVADASQRTAEEAKFAARETALSEKRKTVVKQGELAVNKIYGDMADERYKRELKIQQTVADTQANLDKENYEARIQQNEITAANELAALKDSSDERGRAAIRDKQYHADVAAWLDAEAAKTKRITDLKKADLDYQDEIINAAEKHGQMTDIEVQNARNEVILARARVAEEEKIAQQIALQRALASDDQNRANEAIQRIRELDTEIIKLRGSVTTLGDTFRKSFTDLLAKGIEDVITKAKTLKQAVHDIISGFGTTLLQTGAKQVSQSVVRLIVDSTSSQKGDNGIFGWLGKIFGDSASRGTEANPMVVKISEFQMGLMKAGGGGSGFGIPGLGGISDFFEGLFPEAFATDVVAGTSLSFADALAAGIIALGDGGLLKGPAHSEGGMLINAEGGEYVLNKRATRKYLPLLEAMNREAVGKKIPKYAAGGMVGSAVAGAAAGVHVQDSSLTQNSVKIEFNGLNPSVSGGSPGAQQFGKDIAALIQGQLVKEMRPGGLLSKG